MGVGASVALRDACRLNHVTAVDGAGCCLQPAAFKYPAQRHQQRFQIGLLGFETLGGKGEIHGFAAVGQQIQRGGFRFGHGQTLGLLLCTLCQLGSKAQRLGQGLRHRRGTVGLPLALNEILPRLPAFAVALQHGQFFCHVQRKGVFDARAACFGFYWIFSKSREVLVFHKAKVFNAGFNPVVKARLHFQKRMQFTRVYRRIAAVLADGD